MQKIDKIRGGKTLRIGKLCLDGCQNYGNVLQSYALQRVLESHGAQVDCLWHMKGSERPECGARPWRWKEYIKFLINWKNFRYLTTSGALAWEVSRMERIYRFCLKHLHIRRTGMNLRPLADEYDAFVVGSDQVWNPGFVTEYDEHMLLTFAPEKKRIAYAASISVPEIPEDRKATYAEGWRQMPHISVREQDGARIIKEMTGRDVPVLLDPTLLLCAQNWEEVEERPLWLEEGERYVLTYFLGERQSVAEEVARKNNLKIIHILDRKDFDHYAVSPEEFLYLVHHAELMYTDSFHGTVFSILFCTPFVVCDRVQKGVCDMTSRLDSLLALTGLEERRGTKANDYRIKDPMQIKWPDIAKVLERERLRSHEYIAGALSAATGGAVA